MRFVDVWYGMNRGNSEAIRQWKCAILIDGGGYLC